MNFNKELNDKFDNLVLPMRIGEQPDSESYAVFLKYVQSLKGKVVNEGKVDAELALSLVGINPLLSGFINSYDDETSTMLEDWCIELFDSVVDILSE